MPFLSTVGIVWAPTIIGINYVKSIDTGWVEVLGGQNLNLSLIKSSNYFRFLQSNSIKIYLILFLLWIIIFILIN